MRSKKNHNTKATKCVLEMLSSFSLLGGMSEKQQLCWKLFASSHHWAKGAGSRPGATLRTELGDGLFREVSALLGLFQLLLGLAELGQVKSGDLLLQWQENSVLPAQRASVLGNSQPLRSVACKSWSSVAACRQGPASSRGSCGPPRSGSWAP